MHKMLFVSLVAVAAFTGCATTAPVVARPTTPPVATSPVPPDGPRFAGPAMPVPPARPETMMGPPQNMAWLHTPPYGCERGPNSLAISNDTDLHMRVVLDGEDLLIRGASGMLPTLPPGSTVYVCLAYMGTHTIAGVAYTLRYGVPQEISGESGRFMWTHDFAGPSSLSSGRHEYHINVAVLNLQ